MDETGERIREAVLTDVSRRPGALDGNELTPFRSGTTYHDTEERPRIGAWVLEERESEPVLS